MVLSVSLSLPDDFETTFNDFKLKHKYDYIIIHLNEDKSSLVVADKCDTSSREKTQIFEEMSEKVLNLDKSCFILFDNPFAWIKFIKEQEDVKTKMLLASSFQSVRTRYNTGYFEAYGPSDMVYGTFINNRKS
ncbi:uncharacterized protein LOC115229134 [Octopus sinensis]|uniref:Uncharacterized protein LOC115229134 n=1 Tax=Octopus sinensis TaxID=2607531 RepID=A0A6P7U3E1_9MOLL|nr:uncharacterized protein LOC115229134 [Octopus sinensis]